MKKVKLVSEYATQSLKNEVIKILSLNDIKVDDLGYIDVKLFNSEDDIIYHLSRMIIDNQNDIVPIFGISYTGNTFVIYGNKLPNIIAVPVFTNSNLYELINEFKCNMMDFSSQMNSEEISEKIITYIGEIGDYLNGME